MKPGVLSLDLGQLENADAATLRQLWADYKGEPPPKTFTARLLRLAHAWDRQAGKAGKANGETIRARRDWNRIIKSRSGVGAKQRAEVAPQLRNREGTRILKDWGGDTHEVLGTKDGVTWKDKSNSSLSAVARAMTGTNRNGPKFFGLREPGKP